MLNPSEGDIELSSLGLNSKYKPQQIQSIKMVGSDNEINFKQDNDKLLINVPAKRSNIYAAVLEVKGAL